MQQRSSWLIGLGIIFLLASIVLSVSRLGILSFDKKVLENTEFVAHTDFAPNPVSIKIAKVDIELPIVETVITDGTWEIADAAASHLANSANPGSFGNIVVYAHNKTNLFGPIRWLEAGDDVVVQNEEGVEFKYRVVESYATTPKNIGVVMPTKEERLTLYTCTGFLDKDRHVVVAAPINE